MPIRLVVNGFFRSGTSIVWSILRESNPDHDVFYEPCHGDLLRRIEEFRRCGKVDPIHAMCLWEEYLRTPGLIERLRTVHPNVGRTFPENLTSLIPYVQEYHALPRRSVLQTNRWHFFLEGVHRETGCGVVHLVRNPFDIYRSIKRAYLTTGDSLDRTTKHLLWWALPGRAFQIREMADYITPRYALPPQTVGVRGAIRNRMLSTWKQFVLVWVITNYEAIRQTDRTGNLVTCYETLLQAPNEFAQALQERYDVDFRPEGFLRPGRRPVFLEPTQHQSLRHVAEGLGVGRELDFIVSRLCV